MTKRILALLMAIAMTAVLFTGCKGKTDGNSSIEWEIEYEYVDGEVEEVDGTTSDGTTSDGKKPSSSGNKKPSSSGGSTTITENSNTNKTGYPIVKNKETLSIMTTTRADLGDIANSEFTAEMEKLTNIKIDWQLAGESEITSKRVLALQSGNMPDIFSGSFTDAEMLQYSEEGAFYEVTKDIIKEWAPNAYATFEAYPNAWQKMKTANGKMYSLSGLTKDYEYAQHYWFVRTDWLEAVEMKKSDIKTMDDFYKMLKAFKEKDPNKNGQADEVPYATWSDGGFIYNPWGFNSVISVDKNGKVYNMYTTDNMKKAVTFWAKVYKEGLVDTKTINNWSGNNAAFMTLINSGKVGCFYYGWPNMDDELMSKYETLPYPTAGDNGSFPSVYISKDVAVESKGSLTISSKCKNPTAALRWLDYLYTNDGYMLKQYGTEGKAWKKSGSNYELTGTEASKDAGPKWSVRAKNFLIGAEITNKEVSPMYARRYSMDDWCAATLKTNGQKFMPDTWKNKSEINTEKTYANYWKQAQLEDWNFIKGDKNMGSDWTTLINEMNKKGIPKYIASLQSYYDRCQ